MQAAARQALFARPARALLQQRRAPRGWLVQCLPLRVQALPGLRQAARRAMQLAWPGQRPWAVPGRRAVGNRRPEARRALPLQGPESSRKRISF